MADPAEVFNAVEPFTGEVNIPVAASEPPAVLTEATVQREIASVQASMAIAKRFPRNQRKALDRILVACQRPTLAEKALYSYARGGSDITGPSIRLAEALAQNWGNLDFGIKELDQRPGESSVQAYAWDLETNTRKTIDFQVKHIRYRRKEKGGTVSLYDPRDIYEMVANLGARRLRACILAVIPGDIIEAAQDECEKTLKASVQITPDMLKNMLKVFEEFGVSQAQIEARIQRKLEGITAAQVISLKKIYNSLKDGMSSPLDWFDPEQVSEPEKPAEKIVEPLAEPPKVEPEKQKERKTRSDKGTKKPAAQTQAPENKAASDGSGGQSDALPFDTSATPPNTAIKGITAEQRQYFYAMPEHYLKQAMTAAGVDPEIPIEELDFDSAEKIRKEATKIG